MLMDALWYVDPQTGEWINALAAEEPEYNEDFTKMTIKIRKAFTGAMAYHLLLMMLYLLLKIFRVIREWALNLSFKSM